MTDNPSSAHEGSSGPVTGSPETSARVSEPTPHTDNTASTSELWEKVRDATFVATVSDELTALRSRMEQLAQERDEAKERLERERDRADKTAWTLRDTRAKVERQEAVIEAARKLVARGWAHDKNWSALTVALAALGDNEKPNPEPKPKMVPAPIPSEFHGGGVGGRP